MINKSDRRQILERSDAALNTIILFRKNLWKGSVLSWTLVGSVAPTPHQAVGSGLGGSWMVMESREDRSSDSGSSSCLSLWDRKRGFSDRCSPEQVRSSAGSHVTRSTWRGRRWHHIITWQESGGTGGDVSAWRGRALPAAEQTWRPEWRRGRRLQEMRQHEDLTEALNLKILQRKLVSISQE